MRKLYRWKHGALPDFNRDLIKARPDWAAKIGEIAAYFTLLEATASALFMILLAGQHEAAFFIYYDLLKGDPRRSTRERIFAKIAETRELPKELPQDLLLSEIMELWDDIEAVGSCRNEVVHAIWASIEGYPDALFVVKDRLEWLTNSNAGLTCAIAHSRGLSDYSVPLGLPTITGFYKYELTDLQEIVDDILTLHKRAMEMHETLSNLTFQASVKPPWQIAENIIRRLDRENESRRNADVARLQDQQLAPPEDHP
jgi:hypothetical protein